MPHPASRAARRRSKNADPAPLADASRSSRAWAIASTAGVGVLLLLSLLIRLQNLASPLTEDHAFRQTQTAITVWTFVTEGIRPLAYQTPVFGPPWRVTLEFPVFQIAAALLVKAGVSNIDVACRLADLVFFYLSAALLYGLCRTHREAAPASACILLAYVWFPFTIFWSRTSMIDYAALACALAYLLSFTRWLQRPSMRLALPGAIGLGGLAYMIKITTVPVVLVAMVWATWRRVRDETRTTNGTGANRFRHVLTQRWVLLATLGFVVPLVVGVAWTEYADGIRRASPATKWLTGESMTVWSFGTWEQRGSWDHWAVIFRRVWQSFTPGVLVVFPLLGLWRATRKATVDAFPLTMVLGACSAIAIFFNLYWEHRYYLIASSPVVAIVTGLGFHWLCERVPHPVVRWIVAVMALAWLQWDAQPYLARPFQMAYETEAAPVIGRAIQEVTTPDELVIIEGHEWSPDWLYYARRKGLMWRGSVTEMDSQALRDFLKTNHFTTVVCVNDQSAAAQFWLQHRLVRRVGAVSIYKVSG